MEISTSHYEQTFYHKPVFNLNWDYNINDTSSLSTVLYASTGNGGGTGPRGYTRRTDEGLIDWDTLYANNAALADGAGYPKCSWT